jgi:hypothetical protein
VITVSNNAAVLVDFAETSSCFVLTLSARTGALGWLAPTLPPKRENEGFSDCIGILTILIKTTLENIGGHTHIIEKNWNTSKKQLSTNYFP